MKDILDIKTVHQCNSCLGCRTLHPQVSVIRLDNTSVAQHSIKFGFYTILLMEDDVEDCCCCGRKYYDYTNATMVFLPPEHTFDIDKNHVLPSKGWLLAFHPDLLWDTTLEKSIRQYTFFFYRKEEALHLSLNEKNKITECLNKINEELHHPIDHYSHTLLSRHIELMLDYCNRFYERQFITRENKNKNLIRQLDNLLENYIASGMLSRGKLPTPSCCAERLKLSTAYFNDLLHFESGKTLTEYFLLKRLEIAKRMLLEADKDVSVNSIASRLGFSNLYLFNLLFKRTTGMTPDEYRYSQN